MYIVPCTMILVRARAHTVCIVVVSFRSTRFVVRDVNVPMSAMLFISPSMGLYIGELVTLTSKHDVNCNFFDDDCGLFAHWASVKGFAVKIKNELMSKHSSRRHFCCLTSQFDVDIGSICEPFQQAASLRFSSVTSSCVFRSPWRSSVSSAN